MNVPNSKQKQVFLKCYGQKAQLEKAIRAILRGNLNKTRISILGKFLDDRGSESNDRSDGSALLSNFFKELLGEEMNWGTFYSPEIGSVFVTGFLVSIFQSRVGDKMLGELSVGPYGILRGLGVSEVETTLNVNKLKKGDYLLLIRSNLFEIGKLENILKKMEK